LELDTDTADLGGGEVEAMSLDVYLKTDSAQKRTGSGIFIRDGGSTREVSRDEWDENFPGREPIVVTCEDETDCVYDANITHNLGKMAHEAGIYEALWRPEEIGVTHAHQLIQPLSVGLENLKRDPEHYQYFDSPNGWGVYENLVQFVEGYLEACTQHPDARIEVSR
jgi:hypothetical protein